MRIFLETDDSGDGVILRFLGEELCWGETRRISPEEGEEELILCKF